MRSAARPSEAKDMALRVDAVSKTYTTVDGREVLALSEINLTIEDGEFVSIIGPSGCGKSTLLNLLAGLDRPDSGEIRQHGAKVTGPSPSHTMVFQQFALFPWMTVERNVEVGLRFARVPKAQRREVVKTLLESVGLERFASAYPKELSGGMKQRAAIARAYALEPDVLLMDEPFGALDAQTRVSLGRDLIQTWSDARRTVVFVTHDVDEAVYLANRVVVMSRYPGRIHREFPVSFPYPRPFELRTSPDFFALRTEVWDTVYRLAEIS